MAIVASPVTETEKQLVKLGRLLRKNSVAIDIILLGQVEEDQIALLKKFIETANKPSDGGDNCHFCHFSGGVNTISLSDAITTSPILIANNFAQGGNQGGDNFAQGGGGNFEDDPEFQRALK